MDLRWFLLGFSIAALAMGFGWGSGDEVTGPDAPEDPLARRPDPTAAALKRFWSKALWNNRVSLLVVAVVITPLGGFIAGPILGGHAAEIWARKAGRANPVRWGVAVGVGWAVVVLALFTPLFWLTTG